MRLPSACTTAPTLRSPGRRWHAVTALTGLSLTMIASGCSLSGSSAATAAANDTTVTVAVVPGIDNATLELAQKDGLFTNAGIKVKIDAYATVSKEISALSSGTVDVAAGDYGDLFFAQANAPRPIYQIIADGYDAVPGVIEIMTLPGSRIKSPAQLAGQRIAAPAIGRVGTPTDAPDSLDIATATSVLQSFGVNLSVGRWARDTCRRSWRPSRTSTWRSGSSERWSWSTRAAAPRPAFRSPATSPPPPGPAITPRHWPPSRPGSSRQRPTLRCRVRCRRSCAATPA